ncbi:MAG: DnaA regulatory inactivator Hda [Porticoccaceae bacterium]|jgi:DnaA family protein|nr:DnaA regulatory inactivator Hda [Porticoccaceae bacterium]HLS99751.1 DnaA regulatory inactivator Hda [Porticoccaceae bacterium]
MADQLGLPLSLRNEATFDNFLAEPGSPRDQVVAQLREQASACAGGETAIYLWGGEGAGRSHLLQAACHHFRQQGRDALYLPLGELRDMAPGDLDPESLLADLEFQPLVCVAGVETIAGDRAFEIALFSLFNRIREQGNLLLVGADRAPRELPLLLPDLQSRLASGLVFHLPPYGLEEKTAILRFRAARLGIELGDEVAGFILNRGERSLDTLMTYLARLDRASLLAQRRVTVPFVKAVFGW